MAMGKSAQVSFPFVAQMQTALAPSIQQQIAQNPETRFVQNAEQARRAGSSDPGWEAAKHEIRLDQAKHSDHLISGTPFKNDKFLEQESRPSHVVVEIGGGGAGQNNFFGGKHLSDVPSDASSLTPENNLRFQHTDQDTAVHARQLMDLLGIPNFVLGHSWGGDTAIRMAKKDPAGTYYAYDPVSAFPVDNIPDNVHVFRPTYKKYGGGEYDGLPEFLANLGGRYPESDKDVPVDFAGHIANSAGIVDALMRSRGWIPDRVAGSRRRIEKKSSAFSDWAAEQAHAFFENNPPQVERTAARATVGAFSAAALAYLANRLRGKKKLGAGRLALAALLGGVLGAGSSYLGSYMAGKPFDNSNYDPDSIKKGDRVYLGVAGAANGEGTSWFAEEMRRKLPSNHVKMFNWVDSDALESTYDDIVSRGAVPVIVGHSRGGAVAADFLEKHPDAVGYLLDPVRWGGSKHPQNATVFTVVPESRHGGLVENYIADLGGRWNLEDSGTVFHVGSHSNVMPYIINDFILGGYGRTNMPEKFPWYVRGYKE